MSALYLGIRIKLLDYFQQLKNCLEKDRQKMLDLLYQSDTFIENGHIHYFLLSFEQRRMNNLDTPIHQLLLQHFSSVLEKTLVLPSYPILEIYSLSNGVTKEVIMDQFSEKIEEIRNTFSFLSNYQISFILVNR
jgi:hypothetical protein